MNSDVIEHGRLRKPPFTHKTAIQPIDSYCILVEDEVHEGAARIHGHFVYRVGKFPMVEEETIEVKNMETVERRISMERLVPHQEATLFSQKKDFSCTRNAGAGATMVDAVFESNGAIGMLLRRLLVHIRKKDLIEKVRDDALIGSHVKDVVRRYANVIVERNHALQFWLLHKQKVVDNPHHIGIKNVVL
jgi:hypothetical protein